MKVWLLVPLAVLPLWYPQFLGFLEAGFHEVTDMLAVLAVQSPALYHHLPLPEVDGVWDGLEVLPIQTNPEYIVTMCCHSGDS